MFLRKFLACIGFTLAACLPIAALAQSYPDRPIKLILPFPPGSATDGTARFIAEELRKSLGQPVVIENQPGADGNIAAQNAKRAAPDGYTLFVSTNSVHGVNPTLYSNLSYDAEKDFEPVAGLIRIPQLMVVRKDFPADDVAGFVRLAKQRAATKPLSFGSGNTSSRVAAELVKSAAKIDMLHVPYRGTPQALTDLIAGRIDMFFADPFSSLGFVTAGQLKVLAVADTSRLPTLPQVTTFAEAGYKDVEVVSFAAVFAPAKTDPAIIERLNKEINRTLAKTQSKEYLHKVGATPMVVTPAELRTFVNSEIKRWGKLVELAGIERK